MPAYPYYDMHTALATLLAGVQVDGVSAITQVSKYPSNQFSGYPAISVYPSRIDADYADVANNRRRYVFTVEIFVGIEGSVNTMNALYEKGTKLLDAVIDAIDKSLDLGGVADFVRPAPSQWFIDQSSAGAAIVAPVSVICEKIIYIK